MKIPCVVLYDGDHGYVYGATDADKRRGPLLAQAMEDIGLNLGDMVYVGFSDVELDEEAIVGLIADGANT
jgi:hypothetical protein